MKVRYNFTVLISLLISSFYNANTFSLNPSTHFFAKFSRFSLLCYQFFFCYSLCDNPCSKFKAIVQDFAPLAAESSINWLIRNEFAHCTVSFCKANKHITYSKGIQMFSKVAKRWRWKHFMLLYDRSCKV